MPSGSRSSWRPAPAFGLTGWPPDRRRARRRWTPRSSRSSVASEPAGAWHAGARRGRELDPRRPRTAPIRDLELHAGNGADGGVPRDRASHHGRRDLDLFLVDTFVSDDGGADAEPGDLPPLPGAGDRRRRPTQSDLARDRRRSGWRSTCRRRCRSVPRPTPIRRSAGVQAPGARPRRPRPDRSRADRCSAAATTRSCCAGAGTRSSESRTRSPREFRVYAAPPMDAVDRTGD